MSDQTDIGAWSRVFRLWTILTLGFALLSVAVVAGVLLMRLVQIERERRAMVRMHIERQVDTDAVSIAEETYMRLQNLDVRVRIYKDIASGLGDVILTLGPTRKDLDGGRWSVASGDGDVETFQKPLRIASIPVGILIVTVRWSNHFPWTDRSTVGWIAGIIIVMVSLWFLLARIINAKITLPVLNEIMGAQRYRAIAQTTHMLAHDVRKPFSKMRSGLTLLANARDAGRVQVIAGRLIPEVDAAITTVNGMLTDIMEIGSNASPSRTSIDPTALLQRTLEDVFRTHLSANIAVETDLRHDRLISVDPIKMQRVFQNIIENAVQAMGQHGRIWIKTASVIDRDSARVAITLGNAGSVIAAEDLPQLFEAFFTKGKRGGTGLGLAIVKKIVEQHGGSIICRSKPGLGVDFVIDLPATAEAVGPNAPSTLPPSSADYRIAVDVPESLPSHNITLPSADKPPSKASALSLQLIQSHQKRSTPLRILAVDDESIYTEYLRDIIAGDNDIAAQVEFASAAKVTEALVKAREWRPDIAILDVDFGDPTCDGFGLSQQLRALLPNLRICIHSNRISAKDGAVAVAAGAEAFVPKPMMPAHLVRFLASTVLDMHDGAATTGNDVVGGRPVVAIVDDDIFVAESWEETLGDVVNAYVFSNPAGFRHRFEVDAAFRDRLTVVILDYHFDGVAETGADLARELRKRSRASLLFGSDAEVPASEREAFDAVCGKKARPWAELRAAITPTALLS